MPINVKHFHKFLNKSLKADASQGLLVSEIKNLYNDISRREHVDYVMNNNYLILLLELYCISKDMEVDIVTSGNLKKLRGVAFSSESAQEFANILTNGLPTHPDSQERLSELFDTWYMEAV